MKFSQSVDYVLWSYLNIHYAIKAIPPTIPHMTGKELSLFQSALSTTKYLLEFGSGGSTYYAIRNNITTFSIESSLSFITSMKKSPFIRRAITERKLLLYYANLGLTRDWSIPINTGVDGYKYWGQPFEDIPKMKNTITSNWEDIDTVFIDGRYRVACALNAVLHFPRLKKIIFHDYTNNPQYKIIDSIYPCVEHSDSLAIFQPPQHIDILKIKNILKIYRNRYE